MDYEKKYKEAVEKIRNLLDEGEKKGYTIVAYEKDFESIFPELAESEDEKMREQVVYAINQLHVCECTKNKLLTWLEKQESETNWCHHKVDLANCSEEYRKAYYDGWNNCNQQHSQCESEKSDVIKCLINGMKFYYEHNEEATWGTEKFSMKVKDILSWLERQGAHRSCDSIKLKFKVGDWVVYDHNTYQIVKLPKEGFINAVLIRDGKIEEVPLTYCRHWTIQDAKDGDVLVVPPVKGSEHSEQIFIFKEIKDREYVKNAVEYYCRCIDNEFASNERGFMGQSDDYFTPATKEQRDLLFKKMKDAGYTFDYEKKELKEVEQKPDELAKGEDYGIDGLWHAQRILEKTFGKVDGYQTDDGILSHECAISAVKELYEKKPVWSEEDNIKCMVICDWLCSNSSSKFKCFRSFELSDWLNSLKERYTWKPTDEQMEVLQESIGIVGQLTPRGECLKELAEQLKKLKGE